MKRVLTSMKNDLENKEIIENEMRWDPKSGTSSIWFDSWIKLEGLYQQIWFGVHIHQIVEIIEKFIEDGAWRQELRAYDKIQLLPPNLVEHVKQNSANLEVFDH